MHAAIHIVKFVFEVLAICALILSVWIFTTSMRATNPDDWAGLLVGLAMAAFAAVLVLLWTVTAWLGGVSWLG